MSSSRKLSVTFHLTHDCNLRCPYCYTGAKVGRHMTDEVATRAVDFSLAEARRQQADHLEIVFFGGEPLMRLQQLCDVADQFLERAEGLRLSFKLSTNGLLLNETTRRALAKRKVYVSVSLDGDPATQEQQRPTPNGRPYADQLAQMIPEWLEWNPCMNVTTVVTPAVADRLDQSVGWLVRQGFSYISIALDFSADWSAASMGRLEKSLNRLAETYVRWHRDGRKVFVSCFDSRIQSHIRSNETQCACSFGLREFSIAPSGRLYPCVQFVGDDIGDSQYRIGDILTGFDETSRHSLHRQAKGEKSECGDCSLSGRCSKWCACINWTSTGRLDLASPALCHYEQMLIPIADRIATELFKKRNAHFIHRHYNPSYPVLDFVENLVIEERTPRDHERTTHAATTES